MHSFLPLALLLALAPPPAEPMVSAKPAAEPSLAVVAEAKVYVPVEVKLKDAFDSTRVKWKITPAVAWSEKLPKGVGFRFTAPPGHYAIHVDYVDFKKELWGDASATVSIVGEGPLPPPGPGPGPTPPPGPGPAPPPAPTMAWAIVIEQTEQRTPQQAAVLNDAAMWDRLRGKGHKWRIYDADNPPAASKGFVSAAKAVGMPALLIVTDAGKLVEAVKMPETVEGFEAAMKKATGL
jgi:hypothetical protein